MAEIRPFRGYRYDASRVSLNLVLTQPYDKITPEMQERYYLASRFNLIPIEKGKASPGDTPQNNVYTRAAAKLDAWIREGIMLQETRPALYAYGQEFSVPGTGERRTRFGFIGLGRLEDYGRRIVFPHEHTLTAPKADRLELLRHTRAQTGQLFLLYDDPGGEIDAVLEQASAAPPASELLDEYGVRHRLWPIFEAATIQRIAEAMAPKPLIIADGHHRYETALNFRNECRKLTATPAAEAPYEFAMMTLFNLRAPGLLILPTHRLVANLPEFRLPELRENITPFFSVRELSVPAASESAARQLREEMEKHRAQHAIGFKDSGAAIFTLRDDARVEEWLPDLSPAQRGLDVVLLHRLIFEKSLGIGAEAVAGERFIRYVRGFAEATAAVNSGQAQAAFLLNPVPIEEMAKIALAGEVMPQKSTDFYPTLLSGLVVYKM
jgi:uncharacterized protein (DUF1015 family)